MDGLRGLAALIVAIHHCALVSPALASAYVGDARALLSGWAWWLTYSPLHLFWEVSSPALFFILSGFVLGKRYVNADARSWTEYYPRRLSRLYLPLGAAVALAAALWFLSPHEPAPGLSWWINNHAEPLSAFSVLKNASLIAGTTWLNAPLWSLRWEVFCSLLLPGLLLVAKVTRRYWVVVMCAMLVTTQPLANHTIQVVPFFIVGVFLAVNEGSLSGGCSMVAEWAWPILFVVALALLNADWYGSVIPGAAMLNSMGATLMVIVCISWRAADRVSAIRPIRWLASRSFSLYLVHDPIIVGVAFALRLSEPISAGIIGLAVSLLVTEGFFRWVEAPANRASKAFGSWAGSRILSFGRIVSSRPLGPAS